MTLARLDDGEAWPGVKQDPGAQLIQVFLDWSMTMGSNVSSPCDGRGVMPFDRFVRKVRVSDSDLLFEAQAALPSDPPQDDNPADDEGRNHGAFVGSLEPIRHCASFSSKPQSWPRQVPPC
jgi:hypothetical protein